MLSRCTEFDFITFGREYLLLALDRCTPEVLDFRPDAGEHRMYSIREHFLHIADIGEQFVNVNFVGFCTLDAHMRLASKHMGKEFWVNGNFLDKASIKAELEKSWKLQDEVVFDRPLSDLLKPVTLRGSTLSEEISWFVFHESQHRGQIMTLMRLAGVEPPEW